jgi:DNA transformation protein
LDAEFIQELFAQFRPVVVRRMFSGAGISVEGVNFALIIRGAIYLKVNDKTIPAFRQEGSEPFTYTRSRKLKKPVSMSYWKLPERLYDDPEELAVWARQSFEIARQQKLTPRTRGAAKPREGARTPAPRKVKRKPVKGRKRRS